MYLYKDFYFECIYNTPHTPFSSNQQIRFMTHPTGYLKVCRDIYFVPRFPNHSILWACCTWFSLSFMFAQSLSVALTSGVRGPNHRLLRWQPVHNKFSTSRTNTNPYRITLTKMPRIPEYLYQCVFLLLLLFCIYTLILLPYVIHFLCAEIKTFYVLRFQANLLFSSLGLTRVSPNLLDEWHPDHFCFLVPTQNLSKLMADHMAHYAIFVHSS